MPDHKKRFESMLFNYETTNRTDFRDGEIKPIITTKYDGKIPCMRIRPRPLKDIHALTDWRVPNVPFDLFAKPKAIVGTNPNEVQKPYGSVIDYEQKLVQKTRPRLVMPPAASLDDIDDGPRKVLVDDTYITSTANTMRDAFANTTSVRAPLPGKAAPANPISIPKLSQPFVSPEWRMDSVSWDNRQLRAYCNPSRVFWLAKTPNCDECSQTAVRDARRKNMNKHLCR